MSSQVTERPRRRRRAPSPPQTEYDAFLIDAKVKSMTLDLVLAVAAPYTDEDGWCKAQVVRVDKFSVKFEVWAPNHHFAPDRSGRQVWINKAHIVSVGPADD